MHSFPISLTDLAREKSFRQGPKFHKCQKGKTGECYSFNDLFQLQKKTEIDESILYNDFDYCQIGDVDEFGIPEPVCLNFLDQIFENQKYFKYQNYYEKIARGDIDAVKSGEILLPRLSSDKMKCVLVQEDYSSIYFTRAYMRLGSIHNPCLMWYALTSVFMEDIKALARQGMIYPTLSENDLLTLKLDKRKVDRILAAQEQLLVRIDRLRGLVHQRRELPAIEARIDEVFARRLDFGYMAFEKEKECRTFGINLSTLLMDKDLRLGTRFCRPTGRLVLNGLGRGEKQKIEQIVTEPIILGKSIGPEDYDEEGDAYYISMKTIKSWDIDLEDSTRVSSAFYNKNRHSKEVLPNDIIMARSGEGTIGKTALCQEEIKGIFADFTMRIRVDAKKCLPEFFHYYTRTGYFKYLVETFKKGLGNTVNIFPKQIGRFPVPVLNLAVQQEMIEPIREAIAKRKNLDRQIAHQDAELRNIFRSIAEGRDT